MHNCMRLSLVVVACSYSKCELPRRGCTLLLHLLLFFRRSKKLQSHLKLQHAKVRARYRSLSSAHPLSVLFVHFTSAVALQPNLKHNLFNEKNIVFDLEFAHPSNCSNLLLYCTYCTSQIFF